MNSNYYRTLFKAVLGLVLIELGLYLAPVKGFGMPSFPEKTAPESAAHWSTQVR